MLNILHVTNADSQEVEMLKMYKDIVEEAPDLFSMHAFDPEARFR